MKKVQRSITRYFTKGETALWCESVLIILLSYAAVGKNDFLTLAASLIGVTSLIFAAKGNPIGQLLMIAFSILYGIVSYTFSYYGEMITYLGMTAPMAVFSLVSWLNNPYDGNKAEVKVNRLRSAEIVLMLIATAAVTVVFYYILKAFGTANLLPSTASVSTSFIAAYLTFKRSEFFALAYAANDLVLIILWTMAAFSDVSYLSVDICFAVFFVNDIYGFISWSRMKKRQANGNS